MDFKKTLLVGAIVLTVLCFASASQGVSINVKIYAGDTGDSQPSCSKYSASSEEDIEKFMRKELERVTKDNPEQHVTIETEIVTSGGERHIFTTTQSTESHPNPAPTSTNVQTTSSTKVGEKVPTQSPTKPNRPNSTTTPTPKTVEAQNESTKTTATTMPGALTTTTISVTEAIETTSGGAHISDCKITYNSTCYWTHKTRSNNLTYDDADTICRSRHNSSVATLPNNDTYLQIMEDLRDGLIGNNNIHAWTSIKVNTTTGAVLTGSFKKWKQGYPKNGTRDIAVSLMAIQKFSQEGMLNHPTTWKRYGVVCEFKKP